ncbi:hexitol phosphatase HxpB [Sinomicrobium soli]|uniref:hexitol phosphatase HxpB n=1 Tax=Sinomicrobium sp. N-1-3-6 TaxID=2219864 RepID=UPI000DCB8889|nr:hexitol phosphatase HxpB [Sinomicrobium sp. N-1-3-6]RAV27424.1 hexitol phosphatase HxpB [Sinomicrobium sp. N-1-3-6]
MGRTTNTTAVIFDMDGVLLDSEPAWKKAEYEVFTALGAEVLPEFTRRTASMTTAEVTAFWYKMYPWQGKSIPAVENEVIDLVSHYIRTSVPLSDGLLPLLSMIHTTGYKIGLSTNAPARLIPLVMEKSGIGRFFDAISSSDHEVKGKPHPAVYLRTAEKLGVIPTQCIVFEDSLHGLAAAKNAGMKTVVIPHPSLSSHTGFDSADIKISRLSDFTPKHLSALAGY